MADLTLNINESFAVADVSKRGASGTMSGLLIGTTDLTDELFGQALVAGAPPGYSTFTAFIVGDYQYEDAIIKGILSSDSGSSPRVKTLALDVDVPDLFDRGSVTTSSSALVAVTFNRAFNAAPEVLGTLQSGTVIGAPNIKNVTATGFDIELLDSSSVRIVGLVSWHAKGY